MKTPLPPTKVHYSPPYKRVRALRLFDSPLTPKTILEKSSACCMTPVANRSRLEKPRSLACAYSNKTAEKPIANVNPFTPTGKLSLLEIKVYYIIVCFFKGMLLNKKRTRSVRSLLGSPEVATTLKFDESDTSDIEVEQPTKRVALQVS